MLDLWFTGKRKRAQAVLTNRVNTQSMNEIHGTDREIHRSSFCKVVYLIPGAGKRWNLTDAVPVVSRDICTDGLSVVHNEPITSERVLIGLPETDGVKFVKCTVQHCSELGYGFYHIGMFAEEVVNIDLREAEALERRAKTWRNPQPSTIA